jgi:hypothetical protein
MGTFVFGGGGFWGGGPDSEVELKFNNHWGMGLVTSGRRTVVCRQEN